MINVQISCDWCGSRVPKASHTRIRSPKSDRREPTDLCGDCADELLETMGMLPPSLPGMSPTELKANDQAAAKQN
jgi:hypothetical protein